MRDVWLQSAILGDWKLIVDRKAGEVELFDFSADPLERTDLSLREVEIERALRKAIDAWDSGLGKSKRGSVAEASFSDEELRNLKALGYLD